MTSEKQRQFFRDSKRHIRARNIETKRFHCKKCDIVYRDNERLIEHFKSKKHTGNYKVYRCSLLLLNGKICTFSTKKNNMYVLHKNCRKHVNPYIDPKKILS